MKKFVKGFWKKFSKIIIIAILMLSLCIVVNDNKSNADAGYHSSYSGGSSSSSSSKSSSRSSSRSSYSSGSSSSSGEGSWIGFVIWLIIIIVIIKTQKNKPNITNTSVPKLIPNTNAIKRIKEYLPNFNESQFLQQGYQIFLDVEDAWMNFDLEKVRNSITDEMFNMYESQLTSMEVKGEQNIMSDFVLRDYAIIDAIKQNDNIEIKTRYVIEFYDYIIDKATNKVLRGNKFRKLRMYYDMTFIMSSTQEKIDKCPNCGAPVEVNSAGVCDYCSSKIVGENTNWVMSKKVCVRQVNL